MGQYLLRRLVQAVIVLVGIGTLVFAISRLTGDPSTLLLPMDATEEQREAFREANGLNDSLLVQYVRFMSGAVNGDFGTSIKYRQPALQVAFEALPSTAVLAFSSLIMSLAVAVPLGVLAAVRRGTWVDVGSILFAVIGQSIPVFWLGLLLIMVFSVHWNLLPTGGTGGIEHLVLPTFTLALYFMARTARLVRSAMLEVLSEDYVSAARARGLHESVIIGRHALKNALLPLITIIGLDLGALLGGAIITETVFSWPGMGRLVVGAISSRDYPVIQAVVFIVAVAFVVINLLVDLVYTWLDPRIKYG